jgi:hypothetical protein
MSGRIAHIAQAVLDNQSLIRRRRPPRQWYLYSGGGRGATEHKRSWSAPSPFEAIAVGRS